MAPSELLPNTIYRDTRESIGKVYIYKQSSNPRDMMGTVLREYRISYQDDSLWTRVNNVYLTTLAYPL